MKWFAAAALALAIAGCATSEEEAGPVDPASCYARDFAVYFDNQDTRLSPGAREVLDAQIDSLRGCPVEHVRIIGLAEDEGGSGVSEQISIQRADAIADYLDRHTPWPRTSFELLATGERGAITDEGVAVPMRRRARVTIQVAAP